MFREIGYHLSASPWSFPFHTLPHVSLCMKSYFTGVLWPTALSSEVRSSLSSNLSPFTHQEILRVRLCGWLLWGVLKCEKMKLNLAAVGYIRQHIYPVCVYKLSPVRQRLLAPNASFCMFTEGLFMFDVDSFAEILSILRLCLRKACVWFPWCN